MPTEHLAAAEAALARRDDPAALAHLLDAWRAVRSPALADLTERLSARIVRERPPVRGATPGEQHERWLAREATADAADLGALLAAPWPRRWQVAVERLARLAARGHDPRIASALLALLEAMPYTTMASRAFWARVFACLDAQRDARALPRLEALAAKPTAFAYAKDMQSRLAGAVNAARKAFAAGAPALAPGDEEVARRIELHVGGAPPRAGSHEAFLAAIRAAPDDDGPRRVYADWLVEQGDPRGEFINLQLARGAGALTRDGERRERALLEAHLDAWLGGLAPVARKGDARFERGFLAVIACAWTSHEAIRSVVGDPAWATVREATLGADYTLDERDLVALVRHPVMRALRVVHGLDERAMDLLAQSDPPLALEDASFHVRRGASRDKAYARCDGLPSLRHLGVVAASSNDPAWLAGAPVWQRLERVTIASDLRKLDDWHKRLDAHRPGPRALRLLGTATRVVSEPAGWGLDLTRGADGRASVLRAEHFAARSRSRRPLGELLDALNWLDRDALVELEVVPSRALRLTDEDRRDLERCARRFARLERLALPPAEPSKR